MTDKFVDQDEAQIYGPYASNNIRTRLIGKLYQFDSALTYVADQIDASTATVKMAVDAAREKDAERRVGSKTKSSLLSDSLRLLGRFSKHLSVHDDIDRKLYFTRDGTAGGVGKSAQDVLLAVTHITTRLSNPKAGVRDRAFWHDQFDDTMKALAPAVQFANDAQADRQSITPEVEAARQAWLNAYSSAKCVVEAVLRQLGRLGQMSVFFYDLRVPAGAKVTEMPPEAMLDADDSNDDQEKD